MLSAVFLSGCAIGSTYREAADQLDRITVEGEAAYFALWYPQDSEPFEEQSSQQLAELDFAIDRCIEVLEDQARELLQHTHPPISLATVQLAECMRSEGWSLRIEQMYRVVG